MKIDVAKQPPRHTKKNMRENCPGICEAAHKKHTYIQQTAAAVVVGLRKKLFERRQGKAHKEKRCGRRRRSKHASHLPSLFHTFEFTYILSRIHPPIHPSIHSTRFSLWLIYSLPHTSHAFLFFLFFFFLSFFFFTRTMEIEK